MLPPSDSDLISFSSPKKKPSSIATQNTLFLCLSLMATTFPILRPAVVRATAVSTGKPDPNNRKPGSSTWWAPLFGWSTDPDYISSDRSSTQKQEGREGSSDPGRPRSKFAPGCFTEDKARQLRKKTVETSTFHDIMYHSAIASRLASDVPQGYHK